MKAKGKNEHPTARMSVTDQARADARADAAADIKAALEGWKNESLTLFEFLDAATGKTVRQYVSIAWDIMLADKITANSTKHNYKKSADRAEYDEVYRHEYPRAITQANPFVRDGHGGWIISTSRSLKK